MKAVILAAGRGSRLGADVLPKPLWPVGRRGPEDTTEISLLERQVHCLRKAGVRDVGIVVGWRKDLIQDRLQDLRVTFIENTWPEISESGTAHSFAYAAASPFDPLGGKEPLLLMDGDLCYEQRALEEIVGRDGLSGLLVAPAVNEDSEEVRVYARENRPVLMGKGLKPPITEGLQMLGEATGIVRFEPAVHALIRALLTWLVGMPGEGKAHSYAGIASEHEELEQYMLALRLLDAHLLPPDLLFMEVDFQEEFDRLRRTVYPAILERDAR